MIVLQTERLTLRPLDKGDAAFMLALLNDPEWLRLIGDRQVRTLDDAAHYIEDTIISSYQQHGFGFYGIAVNPSGELAGICGLVKRDWLDHIDLGYALLPAWRGQGIAREAALAMFHYARDTMQLPRLLATTRSYNQGSQKVLEYIGMQYERDIPHPDGSRMLMLYSWQANLPLPQMDTDTPPPTHHHTPQHGTAGS